MTDLPQFLLICLEISTTIAYLKEYKENIAIQLCTILYNIADLGYYGKTRIQFEICCRNLWSGEISTLSENREQSQIPTLGLEDDGQAELAIDMAVIVFRRGPVIILSLCQFNDYFNEGFTDQLTRQNQIYRSILFNGK